MRTRHTQIHLWASFTAQLVKNPPGRKHSDMTERLSLPFTSYTSIEYYLAIKKWNFPICGSMGRLVGYHSMWNRSHKERKILYDVNYMWNVLNTSSHSLLQGIFLTQGSSSVLLHYRQILYCLRHQGRKGDSKMWLTDGWLSVRRWKGGGQGRGRGWRGTLK